LAGEHHGAIQAAERVRRDVGLQIPVEMPFGIQDLEV
jgi:hypothetical protein